VVRMSAEARRAELLQAALRVMARDGLAAGTTRAIVAEAGMSLATFHYCFRSRNELLRELLGLVMDLEATSVEKGMGAGADLASTLRQGLRGYIAHLETNPGYELFLFELNHHALRTPELRDLADEQYRRYHASARTLLQKAADLSGMTWRTDPDGLARLVVAIIDGTTTTWLADRDSEAALATLDPVVDHLVTMAEPSTRSR
jgi:AcrR family transcriptional regulator